jgi:hypothetical protein
MRATVGDNQPCGANFGAAGSKAATMSDPNRYDGKVMATTPSKASAPFLRA